MTFYPEANEETPLIAQSSSSSSSCINLSAKQSIDSSKSTKRKLVIATFIAIIFFITELIAGYFANSLALMSDAFHLLTDVASFIVALGAIYLSEKPPTKTHTFGYHRAEVIAALISVLTIWVLTGILVTEAIERLASPQPINAKLMCITASIGVLINIILAAVLGDHHHNHDHSDEEATHNKKDSNINLRAAVLHVIGDLLASIGVLVSSIILIFKPEYTFVDPLCTFIFSIIVLYTTFHLVKDSLAVLMEGTPADIETDAINKSLMQIPGVIAIHDLHVWALSPGKCSLTAHITVSTMENYQDILSKAQHIIFENFGVRHSTLQIESDNPNFTSHCRPHLCM